jgi:predicted DsbA family dithiol-disulfide isomerase
MSLTVDVTSDVICPWCYVGKRRLEKAVAALGGEQPVRVRWHPFQLNPQMPKGGMDRKEYRSAKFGSWERSLALDAQVTAAGKAEGIPFAHDKIERTPNTLDAHRLIRLADTLGVQDAVVEAVFRAYFTEGRDISDVAVLLDVVAGAGLDRSQGEALLKGEADIEAVRGEEADAQRRGVTGVPFFVINNAAALSGAREPSAFLAAFERARLPTTSDEGVCKVGPGGERSC